ncbi:hypothetical protein Barb7_02445 [Bacteroidales bacterium Barb7]|nr:hypothetical protein Barb7_02445 [Bacteroidales bacterium Barb7]
MSRNVYIEVQMEIAVFCSQKTVCFRIIQPVFQEGSIQFVRRKSQRQRVVRSDDKHIGRGFGSRQIRINARNNTPFVSRQGYHLVCFPVVQVMIENIIAGVVGF